MGTLSADKSARLSVDTSVGRLSADLMLSRFFLAANLLLCFHICKNRVSYDKAPVI